MNNFYIKMSPLTGMVGYGGGSSGLNIVGGALKPKFLGDRGMAFGGDDSMSDVIDYWNMTSTGNASDFGDLPDAWRHNQCCSNITTALIYGGDGSGAQGSNVWKVTISTTANAADSGVDALRSRSAHVAGSDGTTAIFTGNDNGTSADEIDKLSFALSSNATDFGDLIHRAGGMDCCVGTSTRMVVGGGRRWDGGEYWQADIEYITISSGSGNGTDFGDLNFRSRGLSSCSDGTRGIWFEDYNHDSNNIGRLMDYIEIDTASDGTDFGDMDWSVGHRACANSTRACRVGGHTSQPGGNEAIYHVTIQSPGNAADFGDLTDGRSNLGATSGD